MEDKRQTNRAENRGGAIIADRYRIDRLIARGGMAAVYLAHHVKLNRPVAIKILTPPPEPDEVASFEERFRLEAETLAQLDHPNIVGVHDYGELPEEGRYYLAMEFVDGPRVSDLLKDGPLDPERAIRLVLQVASGLSYAHRRGVVHRDLKPSNLLVKRLDDGTEQVKVVDFGLVKLTEADQSITRAGLILGSPHCMAPEQVRGGAVDHRADIYATGILLFRSLTGQYPFHGANSAATMIAHLNHPTPTFFSVAPELVVPAGLEEIVRRCLEKAPEDRFTDMRELIDALAAVADIKPDRYRSVSQSHSTITSARSLASVSPAPVAAPAPRGRTAVAVGVGALVLVLLLVAGVLTRFLSATLPAEPPELAPPQARVEPAPAPVPEPVPAPEAAPVDVAPVPAPEPAPAAAPAPVVKPAPKPVVKPPPKPATPKPAPAPTPKPKDPDGYLGLPEDLN